MPTEIVVRGLDEFRRDLRGVDKRLAKSLQVAHKTISVKAVARVKPAVVRLPSPGGSRTTGGITPRATQRAAKIAFSQANRHKPLIASILGAGWHPVYGRWFRTSEMSRPLWRPHLGSSWTPSDLYGVGDEIRRFVDTFGLDEYTDAIMDALAGAFPEGRG